VRERTPIVELSPPTATIFRCPPLPKARLLLEFIEAAAKVTEKGMMKRGDEVSCQPRLLIYSVLFGFCNKNLSSD
jgi:hypothetical protein